MTPATYNAHVAKLARARAISKRLDRTVGGPIAHKWNVAAAESGEPLEWQIAIAPGCVNGKPAEIAGTPLWEAPTLTVTPASFAPVGNAARPAYFRTAERWQLDLYHAAVIVEGRLPFTLDLLDALLAVPIFTPPPGTLAGTLTDLAIRETLASLAIQKRVGLRALAPPYTVRTSRTTPSPGAPAHVLAHLWLLRDPADPGKAELEVQQHSFWNLAAFLALEDAGLLNLLQILQATGTAGQLSALAIYELLIAATRVEWWNH